MAFASSRLRTEVPVGVLPQLPVRAHHAEVVIGDGAPAVVADSLEGDE